MLARRVDDGGRKVLGESEESAEWIRPIHQAYWQYLEQNLDKILSPNRFQEAQRDYLDKLPVSQRSNQIRKAYACRLINALPDNNLASYLSDLAHRKKLTGDVYDYFVRQRIRTKQSFLLFKRERDSLLSEMTREKDVGLTGLAMADTVIGNLIKKENSKELFSVMMNSGRDDSPLRRVMAAPWAKAVYLLQESLGYRIIRDDQKEIQVIGPGKGNFVPFNSYIKSLYGLPKG